MQLMIGIGAVREGPGDIKSHRLVVTFNTSRDNIFSAADLDGVVAVKQYGRRLVLDMGRGFDLDVESRFFNKLFRSVQSVEIDHLVTVQQVDFSEIMINDTLEVTLNNQTDGNVDTVYISEGGQTPLWNLMDSEPYSIHAERVWKVTNSTPDVVVAILDTGMAELAKGQFLNLLNGYDFISDDWVSLDGDGRDPDSTDPGDWADMCPVSSWHGTKVASILAARHDNVWGMKGVAQNCGILPVRVIGICKMGYATDVTDAIVWAAGGIIDGVPGNPNPATIISLSLAGQGACPDYLQSAITQAAGLGAVVIAAAGNNNKNVSGYFPANCIGVHAIAASTRGGGLAGYSNWGNRIAVAAPGGDSVDAIMTLGVNIAETDLTVSFGMGSSFAAPHVAGIAALYQSVLLNWKDYGVPNQTKLGYPFFAENGVCTHSLCGKGVSSASRISFLQPHSNISYPETFTPWNKSQTVLGVDMITPEGNNAGNILDINGVNQMWMDGSSSPEGGTHQFECGAGRFLCHVSIYRSVSYVRGIDYDCCDMYGTMVVSVGCVGYCQSYTTFTGLDGWFKTLAYESNGIYADTALGVLSWGVALSQSSKTFGTCPDGWYVNGIYQNAYQTVAWMVAKCRKLFMPCPAGYYSLGPNTLAGGGAVLCPAGSYNPNEGRSSCVSCSAGKYNINTGSTSISACQNCPAGKYSAAKSTSCIQCGTGKYSAIGAVVCINCVAGTYSASNTACTDCSDGTVSPNLASVCTACPTGTYSISTSECSDCTEGTYSDLAGALTCTDCATCGQGFYWSAACGGSTAGTCSACATCGAGKYWSVACSDSSVGTCSACATCGAGKYWSVVCTGIKAGTCALCGSCPTGSYRSACTGTAAGTCASCGACPDGQVRTGCSGTSAGSCVNCAAGTFSVSGSDVCTSCSTGSYSITGMSACTQCAAGLYSGSSGATTSSACATCSAGTYSGVGASVCAPCSASTSFSADGAASCTACATTACANTQYKVDCTVTADTVCRSCLDYPGSSGSAPANAAFTSLTSSTCPWACNSNYYRNTGVSPNTCVICSVDSSACTSGQYRPQCPDGATSSSACTACTNKPINSVYSGVSVNTGLSACPYTCNAGYTLQASTGYCCPTCANGNFNTGCTASASGTCSGCTN